MIMLYFTNVLHTLITILIVLNHEFAYASQRELPEFPALCGGWKSLTNKKCIKIFDNLGMMSFDQAKNACTEKGGRILRIESEREQQLLEGYFFNASQPILFDDIWLGLTVVKVNDSSSSGNKNENDSSSSSSNDNNNNFSNSTAHTETQIISKENTTSTPTNETANTNSTNVIIGKSVKTEKVAKKETGNEGLMHTWAWDNGVPLEYSNWANGKEPVIKTGSQNGPVASFSSQCIELSASLDDTWTGKWTAERCQKHNLVVCEKGPLVDLSELLEIVFEHLANKDYDGNRPRDSQKQSKKPKKDVHKTSNAPESLTDLDSDLPSSSSSGESEASLLYIFLPIGFIYVQFPSMAAPTELWPNFLWEDVSLNYDSAFFRAFGEQSGPFGLEAQPESAPFIDTVKLQSCPAVKPGLVHGHAPKRPNHHPHHSSRPHQNKEGQNSDHSDRCDPERIQQEITLNATGGGWSEPILSAGAFSNVGKNRILQSMVFHVQRTEVRPRNMAVKIWKRIG